jgi:hypothetical protein
MMRLQLAGVGSQPRWPNDGERLIEVELALLGQVDYSYHC